MGSARKKKRVVSDKCDVMSEGDVNFNVIMGKDIGPTGELDNCIEEREFVSGSCTTSTEDHLTILNSSVLGFLFTLLDNDDLVNLSTLCKRMRFLIHSMFYPSLRIPLSEEDLESIRRNPYSHNKPVLRLNLTNPGLGCNVTKQLLVLNLSQVSEVFIKFDYDEDKDIMEFRIALIALLQILVDFKRVKKLFLHVNPEFFINQIGVFGRKLMGAMINVHSIDIALLDHSKMEKNIRITLHSLEDFISSLTCQSLTLRGSLIFEIVKKKVFKIENHFVKSLILCVPCLLHPRLRLSNLQTLDTNCRDCQGPHPPPPPLDCVVTWKQIQGCPVLERLNGLAVDDVKRRREKLKKGRKNKVTFHEVDSSTRTLIISPSRKVSENGAPVPELVFAKKSKPQTETEQNLDDRPNLAVKTDKKTIQGKTNLKGNLNLKKRKRKHNRRTR